MQKPNLPPKKEPIPCEVHLAPGNVLPSSAIGPLFSPADHLMQVLGLVESSTR